MALSNSMKLASANSGAEGSSLSIMT